MPNPRTIFDPVATGSEAVGLSSYADTESTTWMKLQEAMTVLKDYELDEEEKARLQEIQAGSPQRASDIPIIEKWNAYTTYYNTAQNLREQYYQENPDYAPGETVTRSRTITPEDVEGGRVVNITGGSFQSPGEAQYYIENNTQPVYIIGEDGTIYPMNDKARLGLNDFTANISNMEKHLTGEGRLSLFEEDQAIGRLGVGTGSTSLIRRGEEGFPQFHTASGVPGSSEQPWGSEVGKTIFSHEGDVPSAAVVGRDTLVESGLNPDDYYVAGYMAQEVMPGEKTGARMVLLPIGDPNVYYQETLPGEALPGQELDRLEAMELELTPPPPVEEDPPPPPMDEDEEDLWNPDIARGILAGIGEGLSNFQIAQNVIDPIRFDQPQYEGSPLGPAVMNLFRGGR